MTIENERAVISIDGNAACSLLGENLQEGESEFVEIQQIGEEPLSRAQVRAGRLAHARLEARLGRRIAFNFDRSHPYGD